MHAAGDRGVFVGAISFSRDRDQVVLSNAWPKMCVGRNTRER